MNIKEAGQYSNFLNSILFQAQSTCTKKEYMKKVEEKHLKNKSNPDVENETINQVVNNKLDIQSHELARLALAIIEEKMALSVAIEEGKKEMFIDWKENGKALGLDNAIAYNKQLRTLATTYLATLKNCKSSETKAQGYGYKFNAEGNQVQYRYDIEIVETLDYDKNDVIELYKKLLNKINTISTQIDQVMVKDCIQFETKFDIYDSFEEIVEKFKK